MGALVVTTGSTDVVPSFADEAARSTSAIAAHAPFAYAQGLSGRGVRIAILDSGVNTRLYKFRGRVIGGGPNAKDRRRDDKLGHGTQVASVALATRDGFFMHGVAPEASLLTFDIVSGKDCGAPRCTPDADAADAIDGAIAERARIINMSVSTDGPLPLTLAAVRRAVADGIVIVVAAGNQGKPGPRPSSLAIAHAGGDSAIIAGAHDGSGRITDESNRAGEGARWYLCALGERVATIDHRGTRLWSRGTSLSAAAISGSLALLIERFPDMSGPDLVARLLASAEKTDAIRHDPIRGNGLLRIDRALTWPESAGAFDGSSGAAKGERRASAERSG